MKLHFASRSLICCSIMVGSCLLPELRNVRQVFASEVDSKKVVIPPKTIEEGFSRLENLLGKHSDALKHEWQFPQETDTTIGENASRPTVHVALRGVITLGTPYRFGDALAYDMISAFDRTHFELDAAGKRTKLRSSQTHRAERVVLRLVEDAWFFDVVQVSSSDDAQLGLAERLGSVEWTATGLRLTGSDSASAYLGPDGKPKLGSAVTVAEFSRSEETITYSYQSQAYELMKSKDGQLLQVPDLSKPFGKPFSRVIKSRPQFEGHE
jgi:hypothetical protein